MEKENICKYLKHNYFDRKIDYDIQDFEFNYKIKPLPLKGGFFKNLFFKIRDKIFNEIVKHIAKSDKVLQIGLNYGSEIPKISNILGNRGSIDLAGISIDTLKRIKPLISECNNITVSYLDAENPPCDKYDVILSFFLLHKVDDNKKIKIVNSLLERANNGGKVIFIDYHKPHKFNLFRYFMYVKNKLWLKNALSLWKNQIISFADVNKNTNLIWEKETYFGGLYQKVIVTKKPL